MKPDRVAPPTQGQARTESGPPGPGSRQNAQGRFAVASPPPRVGIVRGMPNAYEMNAFTGYVSSNADAARWNRGQLVRATQPLGVFVGPAALGYHNWDTTSPDGWVNNRS